MTYEQFIDEVKSGVEKIIKQSFDDAMVVTRTVTKNNNVKRKTISIMRKGEKATPTIYLKGYHHDFKNGRSIDDICEDIVKVYFEGIERFNLNIDVDDFMYFSKVEKNIYYQLVNYDMNKSSLSKMPHFKFLDMAIVFYISVINNEQEQATVNIHNSYLEKWNISKEELRKTAFHNTWEKYPAEIKRMEDVISEIILDGFIDDSDEDVGYISEEVNYNNSNVDYVKNMIREEVEKLKNDSEMDMYVLTNKSRNNGATCITYPGILKEFAKEHDSDFFIIPSSIHEVILVVGKHMSIEEMNRMVYEINTNELDASDVLSHHVYSYKRDLENIVL